MEDDALIERLRTLRKAVDMLEASTCPGTMDPQGKDLLAMFLDTSFTSDGRVCHLVALLEAMRTQGTVPTEVRPVEHGHMLQSLRLELERLLGLGSVT